MLRTHAHTNSRSTYITAIAVILAILAVPTLTIGQQGAAELFDKGKTAAKDGTLPEVELKHQAFPVMEWGDGEFVTYADFRPQTYAEWPESIDAIEKAIERALVITDKTQGQFFALPAAAICQHVQQTDPETFASLLGRVANRSIELVGGRWMEAEAEMIGPESHVRQFENGQGFFGHACGQTTSIGWEPTTPGLPATFPQILQQAGIDKIYLNCNNVPDRAFRWRGLDGSEVLAINRGGSKPWPITIEQDEEQIRVAATRASDVFAVLEAHRSNLPLVTGRLSTEQDGRYSNNGHIKLLHSKAESQLSTAETLSAIAAISGFNYPASILSQLSHDLSWHQHHDILGGLCVPDSYDYSMTSLQTIRDEAKWVTRSAIRHIASRIPTDGSGKSILVANPLGWKRSGVAAIALPEHASPKSRYRVTNSAGEEVAWQISRSFKGMWFNFWVNNCPAFGYDVYHIEELPVASEPGPHDAPQGLDSVYGAIEEDQVVLENGWIRLGIDKKTAMMVSIKNKVTGEELIAPGRSGNVFEIHNENAAEHSPSTVGSTDKIVPITNRTDTVLTDRGPLQGRIRMTWKHGDSLIMQFITLTAGSPEIEFETKVLWKKQATSLNPAETLKVAFPLALADEGQQFRHAVPFGDVNAELDSVDVPGIKWASLQDATSGAAILSDAQHGFSASADGTIRLTLVRTPYSPPRPATAFSYTSEYSPVPITEDTYYLSYVFVPISDETTEADLTRRGMAYNQPFVTYDLSDHADRSTSSGSHVLPIRYEACDLSNLKAVIPTCLKVSKDGDNLLLRMYQDSPNNTVGLLWTSFPTTGGEEVNLLGDYIRRAPAQERDGRTGFPVGMRGYEIKTYRIPLPNGDR